MRVIDRSAMTFFRSQCRCEYCKNAIFSAAQPHHLLRRGLGGGTRMDVPLLLCALCHTCHREHHDGHIDCESVLAVVAAREGLLQGQIEAAGHILRFQPPKPTLRESEMADLRRWAKVGHNPEHIAASLGVSVDAVRAMTLGRTWRSIT